MKHLLAIFMLVASMCSGTALSAASYPAAEMHTDPAENAGPEASSSATQGPVEITFLDNQDNPGTRRYRQFTGGTPKVSLSVTNQQLATSANFATNGLSIGGNLSGLRQYSLMNAIGGGSDSDFTSLPDLPVGTGINVGVNRGWLLEMPTRGLADAGSAHTGTIRVADLVIEFSDPIANPVLHFAGMGGTAAGKSFAAAFELDAAASSGVFGLQRLSGTSSFSVAGNWIRNGLATKGSSCSAGAGACGSVLVTGEDISRIVLRTYIESTEDVAWTTTAGDAFLIGVSGEYSAMEIKQLNGWPSTITVGVTYANIRLSCSNQGRDWARGAQCLPSVDFGELSNLSCDVSGDLKYRQTIDCSFDFRLAPQGSLPSHVTVTGSAISWNNLNGGMIQGQANNSISYTSPIYYPGWVTATKSASLFSEDGSGCADLGAPPVPGRDVLIVGSCVEYRIGLSNEGQVVIQDLQVTDTIPAEFTFEAAGITGIDTSEIGYSFSAPAPGTDCAAGCTVNLFNGHLEPAASGEIVIRARLK